MIFSWTGAPCNTPGQTRPLGLREFACNSRHLGPRRVKKGGSKTRAEHHFGIHRWLALTESD